ncbi:MAG: TonB-dependent receptor [Nevskia sp.]|nr:TonB-dependent receptor [Nevskia sp.]
MNLSADGRLRLAARCAFVVGVGAIAGTASAQEVIKAGQAVEVAQVKTTDDAAPVPGSAKGKDAPTELKSVQVTGSRIKQVNFDSPIPIQTIDAKLIEQTGQTNIGDIIRSLPVVGVSTFTASNSNFNTAGAGITTVNLRNLGEDRSLVLVNGRRFISGLAGTQVVDLNSIPTDFIERVELLTGGASAIYGSDALAGAVNIILKKDFQGVSASAQTGQTLADSDDITRSYRVTAGSTFANGKGNAMFNMSFSEELGVFARDRKSTSTDCLNTAIFDTGDPADFRDCFTAFSSFSPNTRIIAPINNPANTQGTFPVNGTTQNRIIDSVTGLVRPFVTATDGFNRNAIRALSTPLDRTLMSTVLNFEFTPSARVYFEGTYAKTKAKSNIEPFPLGSDSIFDVFPTCFDNDQNGRLDSCDLSSGVPLSSGVVPQAVRDAVLAANPELTNDTAVIGFARRLTEVGNRGATSNRQTFRAVTGIEGDLIPVVGSGFFKTLDYDVSFNYGTTSDNQISNGQVNSPNLREAFNVVTDPTTGRVTCANPVAVAEGCSPVYIFGENTIDAAALAYITAPSLRDVEIQQIITTASVSGSFGKIPTGGPIGFAAGVEQRAEKSRDTPDALTQTGQNAGNVTPQQVGSFDVKEVFGEIRLPLLVDVPFAKELALKGAIRASDYSTIGSTIAYAINVDWAITSWLAPRAQYARAVRAPNINELFSAGSETFATVNDPCAGVTRDAGGAPAFFNTTSDANNPGNVLSSGIDATTVNSVLARNCLADPAVATRVSDTGGLALTQAEIQGTGGFVGRSPALGVLTEEKSNSRTYGVVITPKFDNKWTDALTVSVDYYNIEIKKALDTVDRDLSLTECYSSGSLTFGNQFCSNVLRFDSGPQTGALDEVSGGVLNIGLLKSSGIDSQLRYQFRVGDLFAGSGLNLGRVTLDAKYTRLLQQKTVTFGVTTNDRGKVGFFKDRAFTSLAYTKGPITASWLINIYGKSDVDVFEVGDRAASLPTVSFHDVQLRYQFQQDWLDMTLFAGINNVFDKFVEVGGTGGDLGEFQPIGSRTFPAAGFEPFGRAWYAGLKVDL